MSKGMILPVERRFMSIRALLTRINIGAVVGDAHTLGACERRNVERLHGDLTGNREVQRASNVRR